MTNRKIESDRLAEAIDAFHQRVSEQAAPTVVEAAELAAPSVADAFATGAPAVDHRAAATGTRSLRQAIDEFVAPKITNPALLHGARTTFILEQLVGDILPTLEGSEELHALASTLLEDEIGRHRELTTRIYAGLAA